MENFDIFKDFISLKIKTRLFLQVIYGVISYGLQSLDSPLQGATRKTLHLGKKADCSSKDLYHRYNSKNEKGCIM